MILINFILSSEFIELQKIAINDGLIQAVSIGDVQVN
jgi:hypothetical protein